MNSTTLLAGTLALSLISLGICIYLIWEQRRQSRVQRAFFGGGKAVDFEELMHSIALHIQDLEKHNIQVDQRVQNLEFNMALAVQKIGVIRYNPFQDGGGNFSFSVALLDSHDSGMVITSMHGRDQNRVYAKKIKNGRGEHQLTEEETKAVAEASTNH